jgi:S-methylmethionine-dependent homocysteine/selenocysteine methylase
MSTYRTILPQLSTGRFLTDGGLETTLIFHDGVDLPDFASFPLLADPAGRDILRRYYESYALLAQDAGCGFILESPTWRANPDWAARLGYDEAGLAAVNRSAIDLMEQVRERFAGHDKPIVISGNVGPRGDGYVADTHMSPEAARDYHLGQIATFADTRADMATAITMTYAEEAIGIIIAARQVGLPCAIGFTTETDGRLPSGQPLQEAVEQVDEATDVGAAYFLVNCAHPDHFCGALRGDTGWLNRIRGVRANASRCSHAELDEATELDDGDPDEFGELHRSLFAQLPQLSVFGGCCGTDQRHIAALANAVI